MNRAGLVGVAALMLLAACSSGPPSAPTPLISFVDAHVHLNDEAMQLKLMRRFGADQAVIFWGRNSSNQSVADAARRHAGRFIAFASISPERSAYRSAWERDDPALIQELEAFLASGRFEGIGEISVVHFPSPGLGETDFSPLGATMVGIMRLARKHRVPVLAHVESTRLRELSTLLEQFPDVRLIWAHGGYTPLFVAERLLRAHPNLVYELSARTWPLHPRSPDYTILRDGHAVWPQWLALIEAHPSRFVIGTDASHRSEASEASKAESVQSFLRQLSPAARESVGRANLLALVRPGMPTASRRVETGARAAP